MSGASFRKIGNSVCWWCSEKQRFVTRFTQFSSQTIQGSFLRSRETVMKVGKMKLLHYFNWHWNVRFENWIISFSIKVLELRPFEFFNIFPPFDWILFFLKHIRDISFDNRTFLNLGIQILFPLNVTTVVSFPWLLIKRIKNIFGIVSMHHIDLFC